MFVGAVEQSIKQGDEARKQMIVNLMKEQMEVKEQNKKELFDLIRDVFAIDNEVHENNVKQIKQSIQEGAKCSAKITVTSRIVHHCVRFGNKEF